MLVRRTGEERGTEAAHVETKTGGRVVALAEAMANLKIWRSQGKWNGKGGRLSGVPRNPAKTVYWGKDSVIFMKEVRNWLLKKQNKPDAGDGK